MKDVIAKFFILGMAVTFFILAYQAEPISAGFGYFFGSLITIAFLLSFGKIERRK
jgi:uncharacterized membrane protein YiaA